MKYKKRCEYCDKAFTTSRKHTRTCTQKCRYKLFKGGFSNKTVMELVLMLPTVEAATKWLKSAPAGHYNYCTEESGYCYIYKYTPEYVAANKNNFVNLIDIKKELKTFSKAS
jgi:hypothetical protein